MITDALIDAAVAQRFPIRQAPMTDMEKRAALELAQEDEAMNTDEIRAQFLADTSWGVYDGALTRAELGALLTEIAQLTVALADERSMSAQLAGELDEAIELKEKRGKQIDTLAAALADMTAERDAAQQSARHERGTKEAFYIKYLVENKKTFKLDVHLQKARGQRDALKAERDAANKRAEAAEAALAIRQHSVLTPIYTCGGHGYEDDDDEDFWCPTCHAHLGTHHGYKTECPRCGQTINGDGEPIYHYRDMLRSEEEWRGPDAQHDT